MGRETNKSVRGRGGRLLMLGDVDTISTRKWGGRLIECQGMERLIEET